MSQNCYTETQGLTVIYNSKRTGALADQPKGVRPQDSDARSGSTGGYESSQHGKSAVVSGYKIVSENGKLVMVRYKR